MTGSGESWKAYLQSANGPCDDTVHGYYWNDDQPMMYFQDVCGIAAGDPFLKTELTAIMNTPAWRTQRSLAIITVDEDAQDYQHPAPRVPTVLVGSRVSSRSARRCRRSR